jgi:hypothetical protein
MSFLPLLVESSVAHADEESVDAFPKRPDLGHHSPDIAQHLLSGLGGFLRPAGDLRDVAGDALGALGGMHGILADGLEGGALAFDRLRQLAPDRIDAADDLRNVVNRAHRFLSRALNGGNSRPTYF